MTTRRKITPAEIRRRYLAGDQVDAIAAAAGVSPNTLRTHLRVQGLPPRSTGGQSRSARAARADSYRLCRLYQAGVASSELAAVYGCTRDTVLAVLAEEGVPVRQSGFRDVHVLDAAAMALASAELLWAASPPLRRFLQLRGQLVASRRSSPTPNTNQEALSV